MCFIGLLASDAYEVSHKTLFSRRNLTHKINASVHFDFLLDNNDTWNDSRRIQAIWLFSSSSLVFWRKMPKKTKKTFFSALGQRKNFLPKIKYFFRFSFGFNLIFNVRKFSSIAIYADKLFGCPLENFLQSRACLFLYNLLRTREPHYLYANLNFPRRRRNESLSLPIILT